MLRARVAEISSQSLQQSLVGSEGDVHVFAVQGKPDLCCFLRFDRDCRHVTSPLGHATKRTHVFVHHEKQIPGLFAVFLDPRKIAEQAPAWLASLLSNNLPILRPSPTRPSAFPTNPLHP